MGHEGSASAVWNSALKQLKDVTKKGQSRDSAIADGKTRPADAHDRFYDPIENPAESEGREASILAAAPSREGGVSRLP
jgi:hypothetical protein